MDSLQDDIIKYKKHQQQGGQNYQSDLRRTAVDDFLKAFAGLH